MIAGALDQCDVVMVVVPEGGRARQQSQLRHRLQLGQRVGEPRVRGAAVDGVGCAEQRSTKLGLLVAQDDAGAAASGGQCRGEPGRPAADDQHVAMGVSLVVVVGIGRHRRRAEAGHATDDGLVSHPQARRPHEGLVVEAGGEQARQRTVDRADVELDRRPAVLAGGG
jgi:hypothetical protein